MMAVKSQVDRKKPAGILGRYYAARHAHGLYRSCGVSGTYTFPPNHSNETILRQLRYALAQTISRHPPLCYGIVDRAGEEEAHVYQLEKIHWDDVVQIQDVSVENGDDDLCKRLEKEHSQLFTRPHERPAWRMVVLRYGDVPEGHSKRVDILFISHHAFVDGTGCAAFQKTLFQHLHASPPSQDPQSSWPYIVPDEIALPIFIEDVYPLAKYLALPDPEPALKSAPPYEFWTGNPPSMPSIDAYRLRALTLTIPFAQISIVLTYCRQRNITLTGFLHGLISLYLSQRLPNAEAFLAATPISMRRFTATSNDELVNHVTSLAHIWSPELVSTLRNSTSGSSEEESALITLASQFATEVKKGIAAIPETGAEFLIAGARVVDLETMCHESLKRTKRGASYEISNVGVVALPPTGSAAGVEMVKLERLVFSQSATVTGEALGCSVASVAGGAMCACLTWQEGSVEEELMVGLREFLEKRLSAIA